MLVSTISFRTEYGAGLERNVANGLSDAVIMINQAAGSGGFFCPPHKKRGSRTNCATSPTLKERKPLKLAYFTVLKAKRRLAPPSTSSRPAAARAITRLFVVGFSPPVAGRAAGAAISSVPGTRTASIT